ncbi:hypothetical protein QBC37DRAFT_477936 [Rhypophila decipiens]|uniref:Ribonucleases P/MRP subunit Pop8-like domain-containing protein n=1 Tax=Rhypophila decipiens TaxID=261697 RepID=A0AAN6YJV8_9PEZI|nr:hypothetical protein QBC37DRAFT_477936 [Rhypophila decipiens]
MADQMDIDLPEEHHQPPQTTIPSPDKPNQNQPQSQQSQKKQSSSSSSIRELTTCTIKLPPFAYVHLSTLSSLSSSGAPITTPANPKPATTKEESSREIIDPLQVRSYCTAALQRFLGDTGAAIVPDILLIRSSSSSSKKGQKEEADIYLRLPRQDLGAFAAAITAYPGRRQVSKGNEDRWLLLQIQSCGDWLGSLIGKAEEKDIWDRD